MDVTLLEALDTANTFAVGAHGDSIAILSPAIVRSIKPIDAVRLAAWLVVMAELELNLEGDAEDFYAAFLAYVRRCRGA